MFPDFFNRKKSNKRIGRIEDFFKKRKEMEIERYERNNCVTK